MMVQEYIEDKDPSSELVLGDINMSKECFLVFKVFISEVISSVQKIVWTYREKSANINQEESKKIAELRKILLEKEKELNLLVALSNSKKSTREIEVQTDLTAPTQFNTYKSQQQSLHQKVSRC